MSQPPTEVPAQTEPIPAQPVQYAQPPAPAPKKSKAALVFAILASFFFLAAAGTGVAYVLQISAANGTINDQNKQIQDLRAEVEAAKADLGSIKSDLAAAKSINQGLSACQLSVKDFYNTYYSTDAELDAAVDKIQRECGVH